MKKVLSIFLMSAIILTLSGCDNNDSSKTMKLTDLYSQLDEQFEKSKANDYPNIVFEDGFKAKMPNVDKLYELSFKRSEISTKDCYSAFDGWFDMFFSDIYGEEDKKELYHFSRTADGNGPDYNNDLPYPHNQPLVDDYRDKLLDGSVSCSEFLIDTDKAYLEVKYGGYAYGLSFGKAMELYCDYLDEGEPIGFWNPLHNKYEIIAGYKDFSSDISYKLRDKEVSLKEVAETVERFITDNNFGGGTQLKPHVPQIYAVDLRDGYYGYFFKLNYTYKGVEVLVDTSTSSSGYRGTSYGRDYHRMPGMGFMLESGRPDSFYCFDTALNVEELEEYDSVISLENAVEILSSSFADGLELHISSAELMYAQYYTVSMERPENWIRPQFQTDIVWHFEAVNALENLSYDICINAIDGSCSYLKS